ncbi:asparaginase [Limnohabitans sp. TEGF004]|uniref:asparaginase n=1 Tax=Limnohabitans sp. TEGF004 TaxID=2986281 RepID=UPI00237791D8|nr:asparaginase [Limnohabitans sp. TEGF004]BDU55624.1 L-asparaginase [Limnohabitans sp. TEGF004]
MNAKKTKKIVVLATGGTIAGLASDAAKPQTYTAGQVAVADLLQGVAHDGVELLSEQVAQIDSKDMSFAVWQSLLARVSHYSEQDDVQGVVITHGTDTLEETAYFLQAVLQPTKPVAITCAMLPANAPDSDGPGNLKDALTWVQQPAASGVSVVCAGQVHAGNAVQKSHSHQRNPFTSQAGVMHPAVLRVPSVAQVVACQHWPRVELVFNHTGADGRLVRALTAHDAPQGWVVAGTGNGTLHHDLEAALLDAQKQGAQVLRASRCAQGGVQSREVDVLPHAGGLTAVQARVALLMHLVAQQT